MFGSVDAAGSTRMILFHVETIDLDKPDVRSRAWLPACLLRRSGHPTRLVEGDVPADVLGKAKCVVLTGGASACALSVARRASHAGLPVILDLGSIDILSASIADPNRREQLIEIATTAGSITVGNANLARHVERVTGAEHILVAPDPIEIGEGLVATLRHHPGATFQLMAALVEWWARDAFAGLRQTWRGAASTADERRVAWFGASRQPNSEGGVAELLLAASDLVDLAEETPLRLDLVGRSPRTARRLLKHLGIPITFHRYSPRRVRERLRQADLCLLPIGGDPESMARSPARANLAAALGIPVVASTIASPLLPAMRSALAERKAAGIRHESEQHRAAREQEARSVTTAWRQAIDAARASAATKRPAAGIAMREERKLRVLMLLQQFQDIDLIVPVAEQASAGSEISMCASPSFQRSLFRHRDGFARYPATAARSNSGTARTCSNAASIRAALRWMWRSRRPRVSASARGSRGPSSSPAARPARAR